CTVRFFFHADDGIRDFHVTGVQTCALPISWPTRNGPRSSAPPRRGTGASSATSRTAPCAWWTTRPAAACAEARGPGHARRAGRLLWWTARGHLPMTTRRGGKRMSGIRMLAGLCLGLMALLPQAMAQPPLSAHEQVARMGAGVNVLGYDPYWQPGGQGNYREEHFA